MVLWHDDLLGGRGPSPARAVDGGTTWRVGPPDSRPGPARAGPPRCSVLGGVPPGQVGQARVVGEDLHDRERSPMRVWMRSISSTWFHWTRVTTRPASPARAVRPDRWR